MFPVFSCVTNGSKVRFFLLEKVFQKLENVTLSVFVLPAKLKQDIYITFLVSVAVAAVAA